ncbi:MAG: YeeE/YedE family protein [Deltaproteobacteria bacterium]|nr:YeeE/YedE family protein [Deltaproteobacteria bacterium]
MEEKKYMNPYLAGLLLGLLLLTTIYITGRGLGASGAIKSTVVATIKFIAPDHTSNTKFYQEYSKENEGANPLLNWLVFEIIGVLIGAFISGLISGRLDLKLEKGPNSTTRMRIFGALIGGLLWGIGSQLGRGCTSGAALSGLAVMSTGGLLVMISIFGGAYGFAYFLRKFWI